jgi:hypothetical protein
MARQVIVDESLDKGLARQLKARARPAASLNQLSLAGLSDPDVIAALGELDPDDWVLVTADDSMPWEHGAQLNSIRATVATIDGEWMRIIENNGLAGAMDHEQFKCETVHRWVHQMVEQQAGSIYRYNAFRGGRPWKERRQHKQRPQLLAPGTSKQLTLGDAAPA